MQFSFFPGPITNKRPSKTITLAELMALVRSDTYRAAVEKVRAQATPQAANYHKKQLDYVTPCGVFVPTRLATNLQTHSGLLVVDFDHLADAPALRLQFQADPYVMACFVSPSGSGLKVIVAAPEATTRHKETYADLAHYFNNVYRLPDAEKVDISGSDPSRACFLSHDPDAHYNPQARPYKLRNQPPPKPRTEQQLRQDATELEQHIATVVERLETHQLDVCNDYGTEWLLIAFSMATLGEAGRGYFHRISRLNAKYDEHDADAKFENALKTTRFTSPAKFFSICKDYGLDVSRPKPEKKPKPEPKATAEPKAKVPKKESREDDEDPTPYHPSVWYRREGSIWIKIGKYWDNVAPNFQLYIKYRTEDEREEVTWVLEIKTTPGPPQYLEVPHEDFCSAKKLKTLLATKRLGFKISDGHLDELRSYLFTETDFNTAYKMIRFGYHPGSRVFFFANVALHLDSGQLLTPDDFGIVQTRQHILSMPISNRNKQSRFELTTQRVSFQDFYRTYVTAHLYENAFLPTCFYLFSLYRDLALGYKNFSPILFLKGGAGTGKSSMIRVFTAAFGRKQEGVNLKNKNTDSALVKIMSQTSNCITWFDEYHNELNGQEGILQAAYDNDGYHKSSDTGSIQTDNVELHSALALTSNFLPENQIFFSRCVFVPITAQEKTDHQRQAFFQLEDWQEGGLGCLSVELLPYRELLEKGGNYQLGYNRLYHALKERFRGQSVPERLFANMAQLMAAPYILNIFGKINLVLELAQPTEAEILEEYVRIGEVYIMRQWRIINESKAVAEFFEIIQMLHDQRQIQEDIHFSFKGPLIRLNFSKLYNHFALKYRLTFHKSPPDRDTIQTELAALAGYPDWNSLKKPIRFMPEGDSNSQASSMAISGCCELEYKLITDQFGIDLESKAPRFY
ncbi:hypothetical protein GCM10027275_50210 [Rhabdobacter roseus]|uniref:BT4734-like N-terminal domain-containing protein n=1 Tax=Rhabdobacter roseus TaxID=1655419 RepID=A0A840U0J8_9BACT|nr:BT4734/BF3469 family protein [Rhabdobacter roseus]MBB5287093.1 hypothetical protein [Rhabdobacter roseus]